MVEPTGTPYQPALPPNEYLEKALSSSAEVRKRVKAELDLPYGTAERHRLDVYLPDNAAPEQVPVLVFWHGGYWVLGHKDTLGFIAPAVTSAPAIFVTPNYRRSRGQIPRAGGRLPQRPEVGVPEYLVLWWGPGPNFPGRSLRRRASVIHADPTDQPPQGFWPSGKRRQGLFLG